MSELESTNANTLNGFYPDLAEGILKNYQMHSANEVSRLSSKRFRSGQPIRRAHLNLLSADSKGLNQIERIYKSVAS